MFERCLYFNTNILVRKINSLWESAFSEFDLAPSHGYLLRLVLDSPGLSQQQIAEELRLDKSTVTRFISALEKKGLVVRRVSQGDQREKIILPAKKAKKLQEPMNNLGNELFSSMCSTIGKPALVQFVKSTREIHNKL